MTGNTRKQYPTKPQFTGNQYTLTDYLTKLRLTILLHTERLRYEPRRKEHKLFATHTTV